MSWRDQTTLDDKAISAFNTLSKLPSLAGQKVKSFLNTPVGPTASKYIQQSNNLRQKAINAVSNTPQINFSQNIQNPALKFGAQMVEGTLNAPSKMFQNYGKTLGDIESGKIFTNQGARQFAGRTGENVLDVLSMGKGKAALGAGSAWLKGAAPTLSQIMKAGARQGAKTGALYGGLYGGFGQLQNDQTSLKDVLSSAVQGASTGAIAGGVLGGGLPALGALPKVLKNSLQNRNPGQITRESIPAHWVKTDKILPFNEGTRRVAGNQSKVRGYGDVFDNGFQTLGQKVKQRLPEQVVERGRLKPTLSDLGREMRDALPRPGMSIQDVRYSPEAVQTGIANAKAKQGNIPSMTADEARNAGYGAMYNATENKPAFDQAFSRFIAGKEVAKTKGYEVGSKIDIPKGEEWNIIKAIEGTGKTKATGTVSQIQDEFNKAYKDAKEFGIDLGYLKNYITHIWEQSPREVQRTFQTAGQKFKFGKGRTLPTYEEGVQLGLTPKYNNPRQILAHYIQKLEETKANINFLKDLKAQGLIVDASAASKVPGLVPINAPGMMKSRSRIDGETAIVGNYFADPEIAKVVNQAFGGVPQDSVGKFFEKTANASSAFQDLSLSGGIPKTPMNAFTIAQMTKEVLSGRVKSPIGSFFRSMSGGASDTFYKKNTPTIKKMQERNIPINTTLDIESLGENDFLAKAFTGSKPGAWEKTKSAWQKSMNDPTFKRFMGQLQVNLFNDIEKKALSSGKSAGEAADIAANAVKNFYGLVKTDRQAKRSVLGNDLKSTLLFAPRYREAMINFWVNNIKALGKPLSLENRTNMKFNVGALALLAGYDYLNQQLNGTHLWENPSGKEDKLLIPGEETTVGIPYLSSIATIPRAVYREGMMAAKGDIAGAAKDAVQTYSSSMVKPFADVLSNSDYFGNEITKENDLPGEKFGKIGSYLAKQYTGHPYIKAALGAIGGDKSGTQIASEAMELPFRFYKNSSLESSKFWGPFKENEKYYEKYKEYTKTDQEKALQFYEKNKEKIEAYKQAKPFANAYRRLKEDGRSSEFGNILKGANEGKIDSQAVLYGYENLLEKPDKNTLEGAESAKQRLSDLKKLYKDKDVPAELKQELYKKAGTDKKHVEYHILAGMANGDRARFVRKALNGVKKEDFMYMLRNKVITAETVNTMYSQNLLSEGQARLLARIVKSYGKQQKLPTVRNGRKKKAPTIKPINVKYKGSGLTMKDLVK